MVLQETPPSAQRPATGRGLVNTELAPEESGGLLHTRCHSPWELRQRDEPSKRLALETNRAGFQENQGALGNEKSPLKGLTHRPTHPGTQHKSKFERFLDRMLRRLTC